MQLREKVLVRNISTFPRIILAAEEHLAEGRFVPAEGTLNSEKSLIHGTGTRRLTISKRRNLEPRQHLMSNGSSMMMMMITMIL
jgi:hypothetical protein